MALRADKPDHDRNGQNAQANRSGSVSKVSAFVEAHPLWAVFLVALILRLLVVFIAATYFSGSLVFDDQTYWGMAGDLATGDTSEWTPYLHDLYDSTLAFTFPLSVVYRLFGPAPIAGQVFVAILGAGTASAVVALAREALTPRLALFAGAVVALLPSQVLWSSLILKDAAVWFVLVILAILVARAGHRQGWPLALLGIGIGASLFLLAHLREHSMVVACWTLMLVGWVGQRRLRYLRVTGAIVLGIAVPWLAGLGAAGLTFVSGAGSIEERRGANAENAATAFAPAREEVVASDLQQSRQEAAGLALKKDELAALANKLQENQRSETGARERVRSRRRLMLLAQQLAEVESRLAEAAAKQREAAEELARIRGAEREPGIAHLARGVSVMLAEPYPWDDGVSPSFRMAQAETFVWYPVLILGLLGLARARMALRVTLFPVLFGAAIMLVYALVEGNIGTAYRHRGEFVWVLALLASFGFLQVRSWLHPREGSDPSS